MKKIIYGLVFLVLIIGGLVIQKSNNSATMNMDHSQASATPTSSIKPNSVAMTDFSFKPAQITIKKGTTVTWKNLDDAHHNVVFDSGSLVGQETELIGKGQTEQFTFDTPGTYNYHCAPHPYMKATITVTE